MNTPFETPQLYLHYSSMIKRYLMRFVKDTDAQDLTQQVFIKVSKNIGGFRGESDIKTWLYRIATNTFKDFVKSKEYRNSQQQCPISESDLITYDSSFTSDQSIEDELDVKAMNNCILEFIHRLPSNYSSILVLSEIEELTVQEVSKIMNMTSTAVKVRLHRARARLKTELERGCRISAGGDNRITCERKIEVQMKNRL